MMKFELQRGDYEAGVTREMVSKRLHEVFKDSGVDVWETKSI
ncbi:MAG: hypothetical protein PHQ72_09190 [Hespellia sp.]|nr:hypothetical protein [Hespellia sp.]